jgi:hypothetical protein
MKSKMTIFIAALFLCVCNLSSIAQTTIPKGKVQLIEFTNANAKFTVPEGKTWYIYGVFGSGKLNIYMKSLNGTELTDLPTQILGSNLGTIITKIFPQNTNFELIILTFNEVQNKYILSENKAWINYVEVDN